MVVIFGTGVKGKIILDNLHFYMKCFNLNTKCEIVYCDNDKNKWGNKIHGEYNVISPCELSKLNNFMDIYVIIASYWVDEIAFQLKSMNFNKIYYIDDNGNINSYDINGTNYELIVQKFKSDYKYQEKFKIAYGFSELYRHIVKLNYINKIESDELIFGFSKHLYHFKNKHLNQRCFILGNGNSLNLIDISKLKYEITFGSNQVYKAFKDWGFNTLYYCLYDKLVASQILYDVFSEINSNTIKLLPFDIAYIYNMSEWDNIIPFNAFYEDVFITRNFSLEPWALYPGCTVTYILIQIAAIMGCNPIYLIGVDNNYYFSDNIKTYDGFIINENSNNYFIKNYSNNLLVHKPVPETVEASYKLAYEILNQNGIKLYNASPNPNIKYLPSVDFNALFK